MRYIINEDELYHWARGEQAKKHKYLKRILTSYGYRYIYKDDNTGGGINYDKPHRDKNGKIKDRQTYPSLSTASDTEKKDIVRSLGVRTRLSEKSMEQLGNVSKSHIEASKGGYERIGEEYALYKPGTKYDKKKAHTIHNAAEINEYADREKKKKKYYKSQQKLQKRWKTIAELSDAQKSSMSKKRKKAQKLDKLLTYDPKGGKKK